MGNTSKLLQGYNSVHRSLGGAHAMVAEAIAHAEIPKEFDGIVQRALDDVMDASIVSSLRKTFSANVAFETKNPESKPALNTLKDLKTDKARVKAFGSFVAELTNNVLNVKNTGPKTAVWGEIMDTKKGILGQFKNHVKRDPTHDELLALSELSNIEILKKIFIYESQKPLPPPESQALQHHVQVLSAIVVAMALAVYNRKHIYRVARSMFRDVADRWKQYLRKPAVKETLHNIEMSGSLRRKNNHPSMNSPRTPAHKPRTPVHKPRTPVKREPFFQLRFL